MYCIDISHVLQLETWNLKIILPIKDVLVIDRWFKQNEVAFTRVAEVNPTLKKTPHKCMLGIAHCPRDSARRAAINLISTLGNKQMKWE